MVDGTNALRGKTALVTGAAMRLGRAIAKAMSEQGVNVLVHYNRSDAAARILCEEIRQTGVSAWPIHGDLMEVGGARKLFADALGQSAVIDILVNNASIFEKDTLWKADDESLSRNMCLHTIAPLVLARELAKQERPGHIVNLLDTRVTVYDREHASYHISKRMLLTLTRMLALELAPRVAVNAIAPGLILPPAGEDERYLERLASTNPLGRHGDPTDVTETVLFLLKSRFITGQVVYVDGGYHMKGHMYD